MKSATRNQTHHLEGNATPAGFNRFNAKFCAPRVELIATSIVTIRSIWHTTLGPIVYVLENFHRRLSILVAPSTDGTTKRKARLGL